MCVRIHSVQLGLSENNILNDNTISITKLVDH